MTGLTFRFYGHLNQFLPVHLRQCSFDYRVKDHPSIKNVIETLGVPHTEVDLILAGGESVNGSHRVRAGERIAVYPVFSSFEISAETKVRPAPLPDSRFVVDNHLGKLAHLLRMTGFDALYDPHADDQELAYISAGQQRILLTHDRTLLHRKNVVYAYHVWSQKPEEQLIEVLRRYQLYGQVRLFERCIICNSLLVPAEKESIRLLVPPRIYEACATFKVCQTCERVYWQGSHYENMRDFMSRIAGSARGASASCQDDLPF
jgi:uncharacterized protein